MKGVGGMRQLLLTAIGSVCKVGYRRNVLSVIVATHGLLSSYSNSKKAIFNAQVIWYSQNMLPTMIDGQVLGIIIRQPHWEATPFLPPGDRRDSFVDWDLVTVTSTQQNKRLVHPNLLDTKLIYQVN